MSLDVYSFTWNVVEPGFGWIQGYVMEVHGEVAKKEEWILTMGSAIGSGIMNFKPYAPLTEFPGLYRTFAELPFDDRDAILDFANKYGWLGVGKSFLFAPKPKVPVPVMIGERHQDWARSIERMRQAVMIWDWFTTGDTENLSRHLQWQDAEYEEDGRAPKKAAGWIYDSHPQLPKGQVPAPFRSSQIIAPVLDLFKPGDVLMPASFLVQRWINDQLREHAAPHLLYDIKLGKRVLQIIPDSFLVAMWLQFARAIEGDKELRACKTCGRWFDISHRQRDGRTKRREFCSDPCKSKDYRQRRERKMNDNKEHAPKLQGASKFPRQKRSRG